MDWFLLAMVAAVALASVMPWLASLRPRATPSWQSRAGTSAPPFLASLKRAMRDCTPDRWIVWDAELGQPPRAVHLYLVPDVEPGRRIAGWYRC